MKISITRISFTVIICLALVFGGYFFSPSEVQARIDQVFQSVKFEGKVLVNPRDPALSDDDGYFYLMEVNDYGTSGTATDTGKGKIIGGAAKKGYGVGIDVSIPASGTAFTGDSNAAILKGSIKNYDANDSDFVLHGIDLLAHNRGNGTVGNLSNKIGVRGAVDSVSPYIVGMYLRSENYGTCATEFGGMDIELSNEGDAATTEYGLRIRNTNNSMATAIDHAIQITDTGANTGYTNGIAIGTSIVQSQITFSNGAKLFVGTAANENAVYAEVGAYDAAGSIYISSSGKIYVQVANNGANADWETVTSASVM